MSNAVPVVIFLASFALAVGLVNVVSALLERHTGPGGTPGTDDRPDAGGPAGQTGWRM